MAAGWLLPYLLKAASLKNVEFLGTRVGYKAAIQYMLRLPSGEESIFTGWPDFQLAQTFSFIERRLQKPVGPEDRVRAVGEIQSPKGYSAESKTRAFAQAGIYTVGQFTNTTTLNKLAAIVLYKDMSAHVAIAKLNRQQSDVDTKMETVGEVTFKLVNSVNSFHLQNPQDLAKFASVFVTTLKTTLTV